MNLTIFNSWQSDSPFNKKAVRLALREACNKAESKISLLHFKIDEATSNQVGSLHIPNAILQNISKADIFLADLSVVGSAFNGTKKLQNPNVLIELGYAISQLGWDRIILLFNKENGDFNDLPFDIEKRCCVDFRISADDDKNGIGQLRESLTVRLIEIVETNPDKPSLKTDVIDKKRVNDANMIRQVLTWFPIADMDVFYKDGAERIKKSLIDAAKLLESRTESLSFHVEDEKLRRRIFALSNKWEDLLHQFTKGYTLSGKEYVSNSILKGVKRTSQVKAYRIEEVDKAYVSLLKYVRGNYSEIDI